MWAAKTPNELVDRELMVSGGRTTVSFFTSAIESNGLTLKVQSTADGDETSESSVGFAIEDSDLTFQLSEARFTRYEGGAIGHKGGFRITGNKGTLDATGFTVVPSTVTTNGLSISVKSGRDAFVAFELSSPKTEFQIKGQRLVVGSMDMNLTLRAAQRLGRPDLVGMLVGTVSVFADAKPIDGGGDVTEPHDGGYDIQPASANIDVAISELSSLVVLGRTGTYPNGRNGLSMRTTSCNMGTQDIPWNAPMNETHPVIAMNLYRVMNGRFEQVGWSWLKHGFFATNQGDCGTCDHPGTGSKLGPACSDTYGTGNNGDRFYLGERKEVNPFVGEWECTNSWFSGYMPDCTRRNNGSGLDPVAHRLDVRDADLGNAGAQYYYEAYYINKNDFDRYNNVSSRAASFSVNGGVWTASTIDGGQIQGPAINRYGDMRSTAEPRTEGDVIVAVKVTNNGNGTWNYEYAVYNHDLDRQVDDFSIPLPAGAVVTNIGFRDIDQDAGNQWTSNVSGTAISWSTSTNSLPYSSVFNFRFDANVPPGSTSTTLGLLKNGLAPNLTAVTRGPLVLQPVESFQTVFSNVTAGNLLSLKDSDNNHLSLVRGAAPTATTGFGIETSITGPLGPVTSMTIGVESRDSASPSTGAERRIQLWNWIISDWVLVDARPSTLSDSFYSVELTTGVGNYVKSDTREVKARFTHALGTPPIAARPIHFDVVGFKFN